MTTVNNRAEPLFPQPLLDSLTDGPDLVAIEHGSRTVTRGELLVTIGHLVDGLRAVGLGPGRGVAIATAVTPEAFAVHVAAHALGCRVVGVRPGWSPAALASALSGEVDALVGDPSTLTPTLVALAHPAAALSLGPFPDAIDLLGSPAPTATPTADDLLGSAAQTATATADDLLGSGDRSDRPQAGRDDGDAIGVEGRGDDIARLNFTSGSTGLPKACARTYRTFSLLFRADRWAPDLARLVAGCERFLAYGSWSIPVMFTFAGRCLITGGTVVISDEGLRPDLARAVARHRITGVAMTVPSLHQMLDRLEDGRLDGGRIDLVSLRALIVTGSPASPSLLAAAVDRLGPVMWQGYGQAESGMISLLTPDDVARHPDTALTSVGRPLPEVEIRVRRPDGGPAAPGEPGEICVLSPHLMTGYWGDPEATREVLVDGWLHTRDLGHVDEATGLLHLTGRSRDVIIVNGEVCYAGAIEQVLARGPDVAQAYVVGVPDDRTGEAVHAFVVPPPDGDTPDRSDREALAELTALVRAELSANHVPQTITVLRQVPVAAGGKPDKQALVELVRPRPVSPR